MAYLAAGAAITFVGWSLVGSTNEAQSVEIEANRPLPVQTTRIRSADGYELVRTYTGRIEARRSADLGFERTGKLVTVHAEEGSLVEAGRALAKLDTRQLKAQRRQIIAQRDAAQAHLDELIAGPRDEDIAEARARVDEHVARHERLKLRLERLTELRQREAASQDEYDAAFYEDRMAAAAAEAARQQLAELEEGTRPEQIRAQQATVKQLQAQVAAIDVELTDSIITAPFAGRIDRHLADAGTIVSPGHPVLRLVEIEALEAWVGLPVEAASDIAPGSRHLLRIGSRDVPAEVTGIMPQLQGSTRTVEVVLAIDGDGTTDLFPGQIVRVSLPEPVDAAGAWVEADALVKGRRGLWSVYVVNDRDRLERADVEILHTDGDRAFVRGAIVPGQRMVTSGVHRVVPGQLVAPVGDGSES